MKRKVNKNFLNLTNNVACNKLEQQANKCGNIANATQNIIFRCDKGKDRFNNQSLNLLEKITKNNELALEIQNEINEFTNSKIPSLLNKVPVAKNNGNPYPAGKVKNEVLSAVKNNSKFRVDVEEKICTTLCGESLLVKGCEKTCISKNIILNDPPINTAGGKLFICFWNHFKFSALSQAASSLEEAATDRLDEITKKQEENNCDGPVITIKKKKKFKKKNK